MPRPEWQKQRSHPKCRAERPRGALAVTGRLARRHQAAPSRNRGAAITRIPYTPAAPDLQAEAGACRERSCLCAANEAICTAANPIMVPPPLTISVWAGSQWEEVDAASCCLDQHGKSGSLIHLQSLRNGQEDLEDSTLRGPARRVADVVGHTEDTIAQVEVRHAFAESVHAKVLSTIFFISHLSRSADSIVFYVAVLCA